MIAHNDITQRLNRAADQVNDEDLEALLIEAADEIEHLRSLLTPDTGPLQ